MFVIAVANQKGGVGKTTTTAVLGTLLSRAGRQVHLIDMDPQASLTSAFGFRDDEGQLYRALSDRTALPVSALADHLTFTPSTIDLAQGETQFMAATGREYILQTCLEKTKLADDVVVLLDCPPSLGVLAVNCLTAADRLLVVITPGGFELRALAHLHETIDVLHQKINERLQILGAVLTNCNMRRSITEQVHQEIKKHYPVLGLVRQDAQLLYATTGGQVLDLIESKALGDYEAVAKKLEALLP